MGDICECVPLNLCDPEHNLALWCLTDMESLGQPCPFEKLHDADIAWGTEGLFKFGDSNGLEDPDCCKRILMVVCCPCAIIYWVVCNLCPFLMCTVCRWGMYLLWCIPAKIFAAPITLFWDFFNVCYKRGGPRQCLMACLACLMRCLIPFCTFLYIFFCQSFCTILMNGLEACCRCISEYLEGVCEFCEESICNPIANFCAMICNPVCEAISMCLTCIWDYILAPIGNVLYYIFLYPPIIVSKYLCGDD